MKHAPFCGHEKKGAQACSQGGLSLIEVVVSLAIMAVVVPALGALLLQMVRIPPRAQDTIKLVNEVREAQRRLQEDGDQAQHFVLGQQPDYGSFFWYDYTVSPIKTYQVRYYNEDARLRREEKIDGAVVNDDTIARGLVQYQDLSITACPTFVKGGIILTSTDGSQATRSGDFYLRLRPEPWGEPASAPFGYAFFAAAGLGDPVRGIVYNGDDSLIIGNVHTNADFTMEGKHDIVTDDLTASGTISITGIDNTFGSSQEGAAARPIPYNCTMADFPAATFSWTGDVDLSTQSQVWETWPKLERLKPGIYYATGKLLLDEHDVEGSVTFIGSQVEVEGNKLLLWPYYGGITVFATGSGVDQAILNLNGGVWRGIAYAPNGQITMLPRGNVTINGGIIAQAITISADKMRVVHNAY